MLRRQRWPLLLAALIACTRPQAARPEVVPAAAETTARAEPPSGGHARAASAQELALVRELMRETEQLRGLAFRAPVRVSIEDRVAMRAYVEHAIDDAQLERARRRYLALGVLDPTLDVRALLIEMMEEELIGYYDPEQKRLAVRNDIAQALERGEDRSGRSLMWRATVVHELVHALQDQHFALGDKIDEQRTTDADNAFGALVEGDATLAMLGYTARLAGESLASLSAHPDRVHQLMTRAPDQLTGALRRAPALVREPLLFRYREGAAFCAELFRNGGWAAVDAAHRAPPQSSQAIRHPQQYVAREPETSLALPDLAWLSAEGVRNIDEDVLGSLELSVVLGASEIDAVAIVSAWRGDRYVVLERAGTLSSLWWLRFASTDAARSAVAAFERLGDAERRIARHGELVLVARGVTNEQFARAAAQSRERASQASDRAQDRRSRALDKRLHPLATASHEH